MEKDKNNVPTKKRTLSTAGFICSLCGFLTCGITSVVGLILSIIGLSESKKNGKSDGLAIAGIVISSIPLAILLIAIGTGAMKDTDLKDDKVSTNESTQKDNKKEKKAAEKTYTPIDIDVLEDALENNAASAKDEYKGKYLEITGRLGTIDSDLKYISLLSTTDEWDIIGVHCTIKNSATKDVVKTLSKDQTIIVKGKITDVGEVFGYYLDIDEIIPQ